MRRRWWMAWLLGVVALAAAGPLWAQGVIMVGDFPGRQDKTPVAGHLLAMQDAGVLLVRLPAKGPGGMALVSVATQPQTLVEDACGALIRVADLRPGMLLKIYQVDGLTAKIEAESAPMPGRKERAVDGAIVRVAGNTVVVLAPEAKKGQETTLTVNPETQLWVEGERALLSEFGPGQQVTGTESTGLALQLRARGKKPEGPGPAAQKLQGEIIRVDGPIITVHGDADLTVKVTARTDLTLDGVKAGMGDLRPTQIVTGVAVDGMVAKLDAKRPGEAAP